jgi:hypothetical protein
MLRLRASRLLALALALALALNALHATAAVFKVVGPDGRVTYTDRPASAASAGLSPPAPAPAPAPAAAATPAAPAAPAPAAIARAHVKSAVSGTAGAAPTAPPAQPAQITAARLDLLMALIGVESYRESVRAAGEFCQAQQGNAKAHFARASQAWQGRNAMYYGRADKLMAEGLQPAQQKYLHGEVAKKVGAFMTPVRAATAEQRAGWCERSAGEIDRGDLDVVKQATWPALLMGSPGG